MQTKTQTQTKWKRRTFLASIPSATAALPLAARVLSASEDAQQTDRHLPLKIGIRAASMRMVGDIGVVRTAASIPGIGGVELQTTSGKLNLRDRNVVLRYKREADRWGLRIPSLAGIWDRGVNMRSPKAADSILRTIDAAETLGATVILLAFFRQNAPDMTDERSYGPVVETLRKAASRAADAGVAMGLENSLSPSENKMLVDLVEHPAVQVYYDPYNMAHYGHGDEAIPGVKLLGKERICMVHVKNGDALLQEPGPIDWPAAFRALGDIQYEGWYVYETRHESTADCIKETKRNNAFLMQHVRMPEG